MRRIATRLAGCAFLCVIATHGVAGQTVPVRNSAKPPENGTSNLSREIHHQILVLPFYSVFDSINFTLEGRKVTLTGQVLRRNLKENAEGAMRSIEGVDTVINQIEVLPASPADDDLRRALYRALYEDSTLERYAVQNVPPVHIIVKNGSVALTGSVESLSDKNLAGARASAVPKTTGVRNDLVVHAKESASE
jgi:hyperosmotically inducible periplasmic protein